MPPEVLAPPRVAHDSAHRADDSCSEAPPRRASGAASSPVSEAVSEAVHRSAFARDIHTERVSDDRFVGAVDDRWRVLRGPNGGFLAAILLEAMIRRGGDDSRSPRVLTAHYPRVPRPGPIEVRTRELRHGRSISWLEADLVQQGEVCVVARAAFSDTWPSLEYARWSAPTLLPPDRGAPLGDELPPFTRHFDYRSLLATPADRAGHDAVGGYIRLRDPHPYDAPLITAMTDAWFPSTFARDPQPVMAATLDLTVHFRSYAALRRLDPRDYVVSLFRSRLATEGFFEEDGEIFAPNGDLIAHSRQLAIATPYAPRGAIGA